MTDEVDDPRGAFGSDSDSEGEGPSNTADVQSPSRELFSCHGSIFSENKSVSRDVNINQSIDFFVIGKICVRDPP